MPKTEEELLKMGFMSLKKHMKSLNLKIPLGATKGSMIKEILAVDPPLKTEKKLTKEEQLKKTLIASDIYNEEKKDSDTQPLPQSLVEYDPDGHKNNTITLKEAIKCVKTYCPRNQMGMTMYNGFYNLFKAKRWESLSVEQFMNAMIGGNDKLLGIDNISNLFIMLGSWTHASNNNGWTLCKQQLNGFQAPPDAEHATALMLSVFVIPDFIKKMRLIMQIYELRGEVLDSLYFMDTFNESMREIMTNDAYSKIYLASIILSKFRNEDIKVCVFSKVCIQFLFVYACIQLKGTERYKNIIDFLQKISVQPTAKEMFQAKRWNTLRKKGKLVEELNKPQLVMNNFEFNQIRAKAIQFGSAIEPQNARMELSKMDKKTKQEQIKKDVGKIDTKMLQNKLQNALKNKLSQNQNDDNNNDEADDEKKDESHNENDDLSKYRKMIKMKVPINAIKLKMTNDNVNPSIIDQFVIEHGIENEAKENDTHEPVAKNVNNAQPRRLPNQLMAAIHGNTYVAPAPAPVPGPPPAPAPIPNAAPMGVHAYGVNNGMVSSSIVPKHHENVGIVWTSAYGRFKNIERTLHRLKAMCRRMDTQLERIRNGENEIYGDADNDQKNDDDEKTDFYDDSFNFYMAMIDRLSDGMKLWMNKHDENKEIVKKLEFAYHSRFRPLIFKSLTSTRYNALSVAANAYDEDMFVPDDIIGVIWMFVRPFDELVELKFSVDCINEFFNNAKNKIVVKKLPIQSHRGYEPEYQMI